jgi:hypothetical protein
LIPLGCPNWWNEAASCYRAPSRSGTPFFSARFFLGRDDDMLISSGKNR